MPDSKLAEKLGFEIETTLDVAFINWPPPTKGICASTCGSGRPATNPEIALWNLCLELSERLARFEGATKDLLLTFGERSGECFTCDLVVKRDGHSGDCPIPALENLLAEKGKKA